MAFETDHVFIWVSAGAADEAGRLAAFGLAEGPPNVHSGQGTACRRFFFANCYLELLWVSNAAEAQSATVRPARLWERWQQQATGACPFGLVFRPGIRHEAGVPFSSWEYRPPYLPAPLCIHVATNVHALTEPMLCYLPFATRPDSYPLETQPPLQHRAGLREVSRVELAAPHAEDPSPEMVTLTDSSLVRLRAGAEFLIELGFDGETHGQEADFRPVLPLLFRW